MKKRLPGYAFRLSRLRCLMCASVLFCVPDTGRPRMAIVASHRVNIRSTAEQGTCTSISFLFAARDIAIRRPSPPSLFLPAEIQICDHRCGSGHFSDYNCNWRDRGAHCRFCFDDLDAALVADKAAKRNGGRVIM